MMGDLIVACSGFYIIFVVLICGFTILDKLTCFTDKTLEVMEIPRQARNDSEWEGRRECKKKPAIEADNNERLKYNTIEV